MRRPTPPLAPPARALAPLLPAAAAALLAACAGHVAWQAPPEGARASLRLDAPDLIALQVHPDGDHCGPVLDLPAEADPRQRADRLLALPAGQPVALRLTWPHKYTEDCHALLRFVPAAGGAYRVSTQAYVGRCEAIVEALPGTRTPPVEVTPMRAMPFTVAGCTR